MVDTYLLCFRAAHAYTLTHIIGLSLFNLIVDAWVRGACVQRVCSRFPIIYPTQKIPFIERTLYFRQKINAFHRNRDKQQKKMNRVDEWINCFQIRKCRATWTRDRKNNVQRYSAHTEKMWNHQGKKLKVIERTSKTTAEIRMLHWMHVCLYCRCRCCGCLVCSSIATDFCHNFVVSHHRRKSMKPYIILVVPGIKGGR